MKTTVLLIELALFLGLSGCGGSGGSASSTEQVQTGHFIDAPVQGLSYSTTSQSGTTDATGLFNYKTGETVQFKLYGQPLLSSVGFTTLTPFDIAAGSSNPNYSINLIRFLMTVDEDNNPSNGIKLPSYTSSFQVDFNQSIADFESDSRTSSFLASTAANRPLVAVQTAVEHIANSISQINTEYKLDLRGKTGRSVIRNSKCSNGLELGWQYSFDSSSISLVGNDTFITNNNSICTSGQQETLRVNYADTDLDGSFLACAPLCTYKQLNRITYIPSDPDGRAAVEWSWHTPNTKKIYSAKTIVHDPRNPGQQAALSTFFEVLSLD